MNKNTGQTEFINSYPASTTVVPEVIERLISDLKKYEYGQNEIDEIAVSLDEAITNAIQETIELSQSLRFDGETTETRDVTVSYAITKDIFDATVIDHGKGLDIYNTLISTPQSGSINYMHQIISYASESERRKLRVRLNGREIPLRGIGAGLKIILTFMDAVTIDLIDKQHVIAQSIAGHANGTIFTMKRKRRYQ
jgi:anti-sigma regulatory factor (Ser/Thr protein kinase)